MIKIKPNDIAFDIDGVVADTMSSFINIAKKDFGIDGIKKEDIHTYWLEECLPISDEIIKAIISKILKDPFGTNLKPIEGAVETLTNLAKHSPLFFITARPIREPIVEWLRNVLREVPPSEIKVIATGKHEAKTEVLKDLEINYFVEDNLETCCQLDEAGLKPIVYDHPWNRQQVSFLRIKNWYELKQMLDL